VSAGEENAKKQENAMLDKKGMEELSAWNFSAKQANNVEE